jgi:PhzF family phenazine biosynthesis protein
MKQKIYQADAFADKLFAGNPAAVIPLQQWLTDATMQNIAMENNLAETAFYIPEGNNFHIRWFTPNTEVDLCGHATLATAYVLFNFENFAGDELIFNSRSGPLKVTRKTDMLTLDFPQDDFSEIKMFPALLAGFNIAPQKAFQGKTDYMLVYANENEVRNLWPEFKLVALLDARGVIVTAPGDNVDFVSRFFAPKCGIDEDPVTGSAHTTLAPYWAKVLGKNELSALQISKRGGNLSCRLNGDRVEISGKAVLYMKGEIEIG